MLACNSNWSWTMVSLIHKSLINQLCLVGQVSLSWLTNFSDFITYLVSTWGYWKWSQLLSMPEPKAFGGDEIFPSLSNAKKRSRLLISHLWYLLVHKLVLLALVSLKKWNMNFPICSIRSLSRQKILEMGQLRS